MFDLKKKIKELAYTAVSMAEKTLNSASGQEKKSAAIEYVIAMLPAPFIFKGIVSVLLSEFIDESVENAVEYMQSVKNSEA